MSDLFNAARIQNFNLFGEVGDLPDVVHCESIEARSKVHNWEFVAHRHAQLHQVIVIEQGGGRAVLEGRDEALAPAKVINVPVGSVHAFSFLKGTAGWVVTLAAEIMDESLQEHEGLRSMLECACVFDSTTNINCLSKSIFDEFAGRGFARAHILRSLSGLLMGLVAREISASGYAAYIVSDSPLQRRFEALVESRYLDHWTVSDYARELAVSTTHLSRVSRKAVGFSASRVIEQRMIREARRQLTYTNLTVTEIAYALGYSDPAYFSRVFAKATGFPPRDFRTRMVRPGRRTTLEDSFHGKPSWRRSI